MTRALANLTDFVQRERERKNTKKKKGERENGMIKKKMKKKEMLTGGIEPPTS